MISARPAASHHRSLMPGWADTPEVFARVLPLAEGLLLQKITRIAKNQGKMRRAIVMLMSSQGQPVPDIAYLLEPAAAQMIANVRRRNVYGFGVPGSRQ
jgi:hypothetical protein